MKQDPDPQPDRLRDLLDKWRSGDRNALGELLLLLQPWLREELRRAMGGKDVNAQSSMDLAQTAVVNFLTWGPRFTPKSGAQLRALLRRIAMNEMIDQGRREMLGAGHVESQHASSPSLSGFGPAARSTEQPSRSAERNEESNWVRLALQFLHPDERYLMLANAVEGLEWGAIATTLGLPSADAARMRYTRLTVKTADVVRRLRAGELPEGTAAVEAGGGLPSSRPSDVH